MAGTGRGREIKEDDVVVALDADGVKISGTVVQIAAEHGAFWMVEAGIGERRMFLTRDLVVRVLDADAGTYNRSCTPGFGRPQAKDPVADDGEA
ncbi:hypothetical protein GCM10023081_39350 [Arthrobacter ginkgonis]|uniref:Uncharacterized protein n=1 Tax=Arthrobacter ginkgonis TaxID=1630594 RepID=A0ABP7D2T4_9MICC